MQNMKEKNLKILFEIDHHGNLISMKDENGKDFPEANDPSVDFRDVVLVNIAFGIAKSEDKRENPVVPDPAKGKGGKKRPGPDCGPGQCSVWNPVKRKYECVLC